MMKIAVRTRSRLLLPTAVTASITSCRIDGRHCAVHHSLIERIDELTPGSEPVRPATSAAPGK